MEFISNFSNNHLFAKQICWNELIQAQAPALFLEGLCGGQTDLILASLGSGATLLRTSHQCAFPWLPVLNYAIS